MLIRSVVDSDWRFHDQCGSHQVSLNLKMTTAQIVLFSNTITWRISFHLLMTWASRFKPWPIDLIPFPGNTHHKSHDRNLGGNRVSEHAFVQIILPFKVAEHCFGSLWVYVICQITARERFQLTSWNLAGEKFTDERLWLTGKTWRFRSFHGNTND